MAFSKARSIVRWLATLIRSSMVGLLATAGDLGTLALLVHGFGVHKQIANIPSPIPGLIIMFIGNKYFAFGDKSDQLVRQGSLFLIIELGAYFLNLLFFAVFAHYDMNIYLARMLGTALSYLGFSFPMWSIFVFRRPAEASSDTMTESHPQCAGGHEESIKETRT